MIQNKTFPFEANDFKIQAPKYCSTINRIDEHLAYFKRTHNWDADINEIDIFGHCWSLAWYHFTQSEISVKRWGRLISLNGPHAIFIPPFSIIEWQVKRGKTEFEALISDYELPPGLPQEPFLLKRDPQASIPQSFEEIIQFLNEGVYLESLAKEELLSAVAIKTKKFIDMNFDKDCFITEMAKELNYSHAVMDRAFKKCYDLTPLEYRNRLRVLESAHRMILQSRTVSQASQEVGFAGTDTYNKQFKKIMTVPPSKYASPLLKFNDSQTELNSLK